MDFVLEEVGGGGVRLSCNHVDIDRMIKSPNEGFWGGEGEQGWQGDGDGRAGYRARKRWAAEFEK